MARRRRRDIDVFGLSFLDVLANTIGGLAFLLVFAVFLAGETDASAPTILTERIPIAHAGKEYSVWLSARDGLGRYRWTVTDAPSFLQLDRDTGRLHGLPPEKGDQQSYKFKVRCASSSKDSKLAGPERELDLVVLPLQPAFSTPLRLRTSGKLPSASLNSDYALAMSAEGGQSPYSWKGDGAIPPGLAISPQGTLDGRPTRTGAFQFGIQVTAADHETRKQIVVLEVVEHKDCPPPPPPLKVVTSSIPVVVTGSQYALWLAAEGGYPPYRWSASGIPEWLQPDSSGRGFVGTAKVEDVGAHQVSWSVEDSRGSKASSSAQRLAVVPSPRYQPEALTIKTEALPPAWAEQPYAVTLAAEGGFPPYTWIVLKPPEGMTYTQDGTLTGTPPHAGDLDISVQLKDSIGKAVERRIAWKVRPPVKPLDLLTQQLPGARVGMTYQLALSAMGGLGPYEWSIARGELPRGLALHGCRLEGIPEQPGAHTLEFKVRDLSGTEVSSKHSLQLDVSRAVPALNVVAQRFPTLIVGEPTSLALVAEGGMQPYSWKMQSQALGGIVASDIGIQGTPTAEGTAALNVAVEDAAGQQAVRQLRLNARRFLPNWWFWAAATCAAFLAIVVAWVVARLRQFRPRKLEVATKCLPRGRASFQYEVQLACVGGLPPYQWELVDGELPPGMSLEPDGRVQGVPFHGISVKEQREFRFVVLVRDQLGATAKQTL